MLTMHMQMTFAVLILLQLFSGNVSADIFHKEYCGFEQKCASNLTDVEQIEKSCCRPCECIDICKEKGTCCADKGGLGDLTDVIKQKCLPAAYTTEGVHELTGIQSYYTRAHCPKAFEDSTIKEKCENQTTYSLDDITFVSSDDGTIVYKNKFCGQCHGEISTIPWNLTISGDCGVTLFEQNMTLKSIVSTLLTQCAISMIGPKHLAVENNVCFDRSLLISECNTTGEWEELDGDLQELCLNATGALYYNHVTSRGLLTYRNVYCYLCNSKTNSARETCAPPGIRFPALESVLSLINENLQLEDHDRNSNECSEDQILDTFFNIMRNKTLSDKNFETIAYVSDYLDSAEIFSTGNMCRRLYCPTFFLPRYGHCIPIINTKYHYPLVIRIVAQEPINNSETLRNELKSRYVSVLKRLGIGRCKLCNVYIYMMRTLNDSLLPDMYARFALTTSEKCKIDKMVSKLAEFEMKPIYIKIRLAQKLRAFKAFWDYQTSLPSESFEELLQLKSSTVCPTMPLTRASHCPKVKLTAEEYQVVLKKHINAADLLSAPNQEDGNRTVYVCCNKYVVNQGSTGVAKEMHAVIAFIVIEIIAGVTLPRN